MVDYMAASAKQTKPKKKASAKKPAGKAKQPAKQADGLGRELTAFLLIVGGILLGIFLYIPSGVVGGFVKNLFLGLWGIPVFLLPLLVIANGIHLAVNKGYFENLNKYIVLLISLFLLSGLIHMISGDAMSSPLLLSSMQTYFLDGASGIGGGLFGGLLADTLRSLIGTPATVVVLLALLIVAVMILTKWSPVKALLRTLLQNYARAKAAKERYQEEAQQIMEEAYVPAPPVEEPRRRRRMQVFDDEDVVRTPQPEEAETEEEPYLPPSLRNVELEEGEPFAAVSAEEEDNIDEILKNAIPDTPPTFAFAEPEPSADALEEDIPAYRHTEDGVPPWDEPIEKAEAEDAEEPHGAASADEGEGDGREVEKELAEAGMESLAEVEEEDFAPVYERIPYEFPPIDLLDSVDAGLNSEASRIELKETAQKLVSTLKSFHVDAKLLNVSKGPAVTRYELLPGEGVKVSKIVNLADDIALRLAATGVRIEAPIPNKEAIGIEIPNKAVDMVHLREVLDSEEFRTAKTRLAFAVGKDIAGKNVIFDIGKMPHVLIAGATGSGKSVCINTLITSLIYKSDPNDVKMLMIDPKVVELGIYNGIPHLLIPVVTDPKRASGALFWAVQEMTRRYKLFAEDEIRVRDIKGYNEWIKEQGREDTMPHIVIIIDELADLMMVAPNEVEDSICRLAQLARAAGMHLVIATQRPSVDVITGIIKANIPSRIAFAVSSQVDSRTILDQAGAEKLLGRGDMLFYPTGMPKPIRLQGAFVTDKEVDRIVNFIKGQSTAKYDDDIMDTIENGKAIPINDAPDAGDNDELLPKAIEIAMDAGKVSASYLQRRLKVGFSRAARIVDQMEERGIIGPPDGSKPRELLITKEEYYQMTMRS